MSHCPESDWITCWMDRPVRSQWRNPRIRILCLSHVHQRLEVAKSSDSQMDSQMVIKERGRGVSFFFLLLSCLLFSYFFCSPTLYWTCSHFPQSPSFFFIISIYNFLLRSTMTIIYIFWILTIIYQLVFLPYQLLMTCQICKQILRSIINAKTIFYPYLCWPLLIPSLCSSFSKLISMEQ